MAFFELLYSALQTLSSTLSVVRSNFIGELESLARAISQTARPQSALSSGFHPWSSYSDPKAVTSPLISPFSTAFIPGGKAKSDLYIWREIFQLYMETEVFESMHELDRGERDLAEAEKRLALFAEQVTVRGLNDKRKLRFEESRDALEKFLQLNVLILNLKKASLFCCDVIGGNLTLILSASFNLPMQKLRGRFSRSTRSAQLFHFRSPSYRRLPRPSRSILKCSRCSKLITREILRQTS